MTTTAIVSVVIGGVVIGGLGHTMGLKVWGSGMLFLGIYLVASAATLP